MLMLLEAGLAFSSRLLLLALCRGYLSRSLLYDLQDLSGKSVSPDKAIERNGNDVELDTLPTPSVHSPRSRPTFATAGSRSLHSEVAQTVFSVCLTESSLMFGMLMCQGIDLLEPHVRMRHWKISLFILMTIVLVIIPLSLSLVVNVGSGLEHGKAFRSLFPRVVFSMVPVGIYLFALSYVPLPPVLASSGLTSNALSRLIFLGTIILGLLSGFGAMSNAWSFFPLFSRQRNQESEPDVASAEQALLQIRRDLETRRASVKNRQSSEHQEGGRWYSRVLNFRGDEDSKEIQGLEALEYQMNRKLEDLRQRQELLKFSRTIKGRLYNWGGRIFAIYCLFRVASCLINILTPLRRGSSTTTYPDLITHWLTFTFSKLSPTALEIEEAVLISRQISLALVGIIILTSIRLVLRGVTRATRITSRHTGASLMLLILAQLMGIYLLSTIVQLRTLFPPPPIIPGEATNLFSTVPEFEVFGSLFDWSFLIAAGSSAFFRWAADRVNGTGDT